MNNSDTSFRPLNPTGVDWAAHWRRKVEIRAAHPIGARNWDQRAGRFARLTSELDASKDALLQMLAPEIQTTDSVLDVGAGAGRYTLPVSGMAGRVTALEPSAGMRESLAQTLQDRRITNVTVLDGAWQDTHVEPHDIVLCAHVVYFVPDIQPFIEKLDAAAKRACYIYVRADEAGVRFYPLWEQLFGGPYPSEPGFADLYPLLLSLGIRPNVRIVGGEGGPSYTSIDDAIEQAKPNLGIPTDDHQHDERMRAYFTQHLVPRGERFTLPGLPQQSAIASWNKSS